MHQNVGLLLRYIDDHNLNTGTFKNQISAVFRSLLWSQHLGFSYFWKRLSRKYISSQKSTQLKKFLNQPCFNTKFSSMHRWKVTDQTKISDYSSKETSIEMKTILTFHIKHFRNQAPAILSFQIGKDKCVEKNGKIIISFGHYKEIYLINVFFIVLYIVWYSLVLF